MDTGINWDLVRDKRGGIVSDTKKPLRLVIMGGPGAGKGTQAGNIQKEYGIPHISTGDMFRESIKGGTALGEEVKGYLDKGQLVPDALTVKVIEDRLGRKDCERGFILDGFPRTIGQAESLDKILSDSASDITAAINIYVSDEDIVARLSGRRVCKGCGKSYHIKYGAPAVDDVCDSCGEGLMQRDDDKAEVIMSRLEVYHEQTEPLIEFYKQKGIFLQIRGKEEVSDTTKEMLETLEKIR